MFPAASPSTAATASGAPLTGAEKITAAVVVAIYAALQILLAVGHEPWFDETQAWLIATSLSRPIDFLIIAGEGHPPLWYWLLRLLSTFLDFGQARMLAPLIAIANAWLLARVLRGDVFLQVLMLCSFVLLQFWGYHFRPYGIVFTALLSAILLDRSGRGVGATWVLAVACGFHFFAGFLFAFWLFWQWNKGTPLAKLVAPALLAGAFGVVAVLSGLGNTGIEPVHQSILAGTIYNLAWVGMIQPLRTPLLAVATIALLVLGLRQRPLVLVVLLALLVVFAAGTAAVYGKYPWHAAFMTMLCFMALTLVGLEGGYRRWILAALLMPQVIFGVAGVKERLSHPSWNGPSLYQTIVTDAGPDFVPQRDLVAWPDLLGVSLSAVNEIEVINGNDGSILGPVDWRNRTHAALDPRLAEKATPYWVVCGGCEPLLEAISAHGRVATLLANRLSIDHGELFAYRID